MTIRAADPEELDQLARLWHAGWQEAHAAILPAELARHRTLDSFRQRLQSALPDTRVAGGSDNPLGFCITRRDELYQLYVSTEARGSGAAAALLAEAERWIGASGIQVAWLACAIGNERAARFYEKHGWHRVGEMVSELPTPDGSFPLEVWRYEKALDGAGRPAVGVAHVVMETDRMVASSRFMRSIGMRPIFDGPQVSVYEMRGGTHLILMHKEEVSPSPATFDLMVDDLHATHARFEAAGLAPSAIEARPAIDHDVFTVREPAGHVMTFFSTHASGEPI